MILIFTSRVSQRSSFVILNELLLLLKYGPVSAGDWRGKTHTFSTNRDHYNNKKVTIVEVLFEESIVAAEKQHIMKTMNTNFKAIVHPEMKIS